MIIGGFCSVLFLSLKNANGNLQFWWRFLIDSSFECRAELTARPLLPNLTSKQPASANGWHGAPSVRAAGHRAPRRAARLLITLIYVCLANERWRIRWERKVWGSSLTSPVITHAQLSFCLQTLLSNWTGHGQLWHMPEQCMHYLQVSAHASSKTQWSKRVLSVLLERKGTSELRLKQKKRQEMLDFM